MLPQIILIILWALSFGIVLVKHGEPKNENYNIWITLWSNALMLGLLYWGGFFDVFFK